MEEKLEKSIEKGTKMENQIQNIIKSLGKDFEGMIMPLSKLESVESIPFGIKTLDAITGINGVPRGMLTEIYGAESNGKSSLCLRLVSEAQKLGLKTGYIDMELAMSKELATKAGVNLDAMIIARPSTGEEAFDLLNKMIESGVQLIIIDSVSALSPEDELEAEFSQQSIGLQARLMSKGMRKIIGTAMRHKAAIVFVNQIRDDINKMGFGPKTTTSGGRALRFYSALRLQTARIGWKKKGEEKVGMDIRVNVVKNKLSRPQLETDLEFYFDTGFDTGTDLLNHYLRLGKIKLVGRTFYLDDKSIGTKSDAIEWVKNNKIE